MLLKNNKNDVNSQKLWLNNPQFFIKTNKSDDDKFFYFHKIWWW